MLLLISVGQMFITYGPLKLVNCSLNLIGITVKTVVGVVDDFSKQADTLLYYTPSCPLYRHFFSNVT